MGIICANWNNQNINSSTNIPPNSTQVIITTNNSNIPAIHQFLIDIYLKLSDTLKYVLMMNIVLGNMIYINLRLFNNEIEIIDDKVDHISDEKIYSLSTYSMVIVLILYAVNYALADIPYLRTVVIFVLYIILPTIIGEIDIVNFYQGTNNITSHYEYLRNILQLWFFCGSFSFLGRLGVRNILRIFFIISGVKTLFIKLYKQKESIGVIVKKTDLDDIIIISWIVYFSFFFKIFLMYYVNFTVTNIFLKFSLKFLVELFFYCIPVFLIFISGGISQFEYKAYFIPSISSYLAYKIPLLIADGILM